MKALSAVCLAAAVVALMFGRSTSLAQSTDSPTDAELSHSMRAAADTSGNANAPPVARRLWSELRCTCGECEPMALADCSCEYAADERKKIVAQVQKFDLSSRDQEKAAYAAVLSGYIARHGPKSVLATAQQGERVQWVVMAGVIVVALVGLIAIVERLRRQPRAKARPSVKSRRKRA